MGLSNKKVYTGQNGGLIDKLRRQRIGARRVGHRRYLNRSLIGQENQRPWTLGHGQGKGSILPSWYPRTPLRDITAIVRAIERKRAKLRDGQTAEAAQQETEASVSNSQLEHEISNSSSNPEACKVVDQKGKDADFSTPQKKLLNSIEEVRQMWLEDQRKLERTPAAKKAQRQEKVRVLMSMR